MISNTGQVSPGPAFFQTMQGVPRQQAEASPPDAAKPVARADSARAVRAAEGAERPDPPADRSARNFRRGSFVDIRV